MDSEKNSKEATLAAILSDLGDVGGSGLIAVLVLKFWSSFSKLFTAANEVRRQGQEAVRNFAARGSVQIARPMWFVILPTILFASVLSTVLASYAPDLGIAFGVSVVIKLAALLVGAGFYLAARKVRSVDYEHPDMKAVENGTAEEQQKVASRLFGRPWLLLPMVFAGFVVLVMTMASIIIDTFCVVNEVSYFISMFLAVSAGVMGWIIIRYVRVAAATVVVIVNMGIDLVGGTWSGFILQMLAVAVPGLTRKNVLALLGFTEEEQEVVKQRIRAESRRPFLFLNGVYSILMIWFITFHEVLALGIELAVTVVLLACLFGYVDLTQEFNRKLFKRIVLTAIVLGVVMFFIRLIDAAVPGSHPVMFYERFASVFGWFGGGTGSGLGCFVAGVPRASLLLVGLIAGVLGWLASRTDGRRSRTLFLVAALVGLPVVGIVTARSLAPAGSLCATPAASVQQEQIASADVPPCDLPPTEGETSMQPTRAAGPPVVPEHSCSCRPGTRIRRCVSCAH